MTIRHITPALGSSLDHLPFAELTNTAGTASPIRAMLNHLELLAQTARADVVDEDEETGDCAAQYKPRMRL